MAIQLFSKVLELDPHHEAASKHLHEARLQQMNERQRDVPTNKAANHSTGNGQSRQHQQQAPVSTAKTAHKRTS